MMSQELRKNSWTLEVFFIRLKLREKPPMVTTTVLMRESYDAYFLSWTGITHFFTKFEFKRRISNTFKWKWFYDDMKEIF